MELEENNEQDEEKLISGIYNYCDRWCERCLYTDRCRTFVMEKTLRKRFEEEKRRQKTIDENKKFWDQINNAVSEAAETYDDLIPEEQNALPTFIFDTKEEEEDAAEAMKDHDERMKKAKNHPLHKAAYQYQEAVHNWFQEREKTLKITYREQTKTIRFEYPGIENKSILEQMSQVVDLIQWYHIQIDIKIQRALTSFLEEKEEGNFFEGMPKDSEGSAMVALTGIERSLGAWNVLYKTLDSEKESIAPFITFLFLLRAELVRIFPGATTFQWPPES